MKLQSIATAGLMAVLFAGAAHALPFQVSYEGEAPGVQATTATFGAKGVETFDSVPVGLGNNFTTDFGTHGAITGTYSNVQVNNADQYGAAGGTGRYAVAFGSTPYSLSLATKLPGGVNYFGFWLSALDGGNQVTFSSGGQTLFVFNPQDVLNAVNATGHASEYYGNPNSNRLGQDSGEPFIFLNFFDKTGSFDKVSFAEVPAQGGYESDNHTVGNNVTSYGRGTNVPLTLSGGVPEPTTWALMLVGIGGMGAMLRRRQVLVPA